MHPSIRSYHNQDQCLTRRTGMDGCFSRCLYIHHRMQEQQDGTVRPRAFFQYFTAPIRVVVDYVQEDPWFETILPNHPCPLYMDIDLSAKPISRESAETARLKVPTVSPLMWEDVINNPMSNQEARLGCKCLRSMLRSFLDFQGLDWDISGEKILNGCRPGKFSFHIIYPNIYFDCNTVSLRVFIFEFCKYVKITMVGLFNPQGGFVEYIGNDRDSLIKFMLRALVSGLNARNNILNRTPIDDSVYSPKRLFRLPNSAKERGSIPFRKYIRRRIFEYRSRDLLSPEEFPTYCISKYQLHIPEDVTIRSVLPGRAFPVTQAFIRQRDPYRDLPGMVELRYYCSMNDLTVGLFAVERQPQQQQHVAGALNRVPNRPLTNVLNQIRALNLLPPDSLVFVETGDYPVPICSLYDGAVVFCHQCDMQNGHRLGVPSARAYQSPKTLSWGYYCFGCCTMTYESLEVGDFENVPGTVVIRPLPNGAEEGKEEQRQFFSNLVQDIELNRKFVAISAPTGLGKTHWLKEKVQNSPSVLLITFRVALAKTFARQFTAYMYQDIAGPIHAVSFPRVSICVNSIHRIEGEFHTVVLDEGASTRRSMVSRLMVDRYEEASAMLTRLLRAAQKVYIVQWKLSYRDVMFYAARCNVSIDQVDRVYIDKEIPLQRTLASTNFKITLEQLVNYVLNSYDADGVMRYPVVVFANGANMAINITETLKLIVGDPVKADRIGLICGDNVHHPVSQSFFEDPGTESFNFDVLVLTFVCESGVSLDHHFVCQFDFMQKSIGAIQDQVQLVQRLRHNNRVWNHKFAFFQGAEKLALAKTGNRPLFFTQFTQAVHFVEHQEEYNRMIHSEHIVGPTGSEVDAEGARRERARPRLLEEASAHFAPLAWTAAIPDHQPRAFDNLGVAAVADVLSAQMQTYVHGVRLWEMLYSDNNAEMILERGAGVDLRLDPEWRFPSFGLNAGEGGLEWMHADDIMELYLHRRAERGEDMEHWLQLIRHRDQPEGLSPEEAAAAFSEGNHSRALIVDLIAGSADTVTNMAKKIFNGDVESALDLVPTKSKTTASLFRRFAERLEKLILYLEYVTTIQNEGANTFLDRTRPFGRQRGYDLQSIAIIHRILQRAFGEVQGGLCLPLDTHFFGNWIPKDHLLPMMNSPHPSLNNDSEYAVLCHIYGMKDILQVAQKPKFTSKKIVLPLLRWIGLEPFLTSGRGGPGGLTTYCIPRGVFFEKIVPLLRRLRTYNHELGDQMLTAVDPLH